MGIKKCYLGVVVVVTLFLSGCISSNSYVDPVHNEATYESLETTEHPYTLLLEVEYQRFGEHYPKADADLRGMVERVLRATGFGVPISNDGYPDGELTIILNNTGDMGAAMAKGFGSGLTLGLVGSMVTDNFEMTATLTMEGDTINAANYTHAIHSTIGNKSGPEGLEPMSAMAAFGKVVEQLVITFVGDTQKVMNTTAQTRLMNSQASE